MIKMREDGLDKSDDESKIRNISPLNKSLTRNRINNPGVTSKDAQGFDKMFDTEYNSINNSNDALTATFEYRKYSNNVSNDSIKPINE
jgi:hypothetical protein